MRGPALLAFVLPALAAAAEGPFEASRLAMRTASVEEGLPNPRVHATMRDSKGRLWVGTQEGAAVLGGGGWTPFPLPEEAPSLYVRALAETADGALWFGTEAGGLWRFHRGAWRHFAAGRELPVSRVNALLADGKTLWIGTGGGGVLRLRGETVEAVKGPEDPWVWVIAAVPDAAGRPRIWVGGDKQVWLLSETGWRRLGAAEGWWEAGANSVVARRGSGGRKEVWISSFGKGVGIWDSAQERFLGPAPGSPSQSPTSLAVVPLPDGEEELWLGTYDTGLARYTARGWESIGTEQGFPSAGVYSLLVNPEGRPRLWAGTRGSGVVAVDPSGWRSLADVPGLPSRQANCFFETGSPEGARTFWIGTDRGLVRWDARGIAVETRKDGLPADFVTDLHEIDGPTGRELWAATLGGVARRKGNRWEAFGPAEGLTFHRILCLGDDVDADGHPVLLAGASGGLARFSGGRWHVATTKDGLPHDIVTSLVSLKDADGGRSLWVGTRGGGVARLSAGRWQSFGAAEGLRSLSVYDLAVSTSPDGTRWLWAALVGGGALARLDVDHPERGFRTYTRGELPELPGQGIQRIVVSRQAALYLTTARGVARLELRGAASDPGRTTTYSLSDGLPSSTTDSGATYLDRDGRIWVGTTKGAAVLDPLADDEPPAPPAPLVERITVQGRAVDPEAPLHLGFRDRRLVVAFALPVFFRHEAIQYRTQLIGLESEPQEWSPRPDREFTTLPARRYVLRIWARDGLGREAPPTDLRFSVTGPPWLTWWAIVLEAGLLFGVVVVLVRRRQRVLERRTQELERIVAERTGELAAANEALHSQSLTDPLTGLANRRALDESMGALVSRLLRRHRGSSSAQKAANRDLAFLLIDLDHFKVVNDTYGHQAGDLVLCQTATLLRDSVRTGDRVVRWGGEEFLVVGVDTDPEDLAVLAERIRSRIAGHPFDIEKGFPLRKTASLGFACMPLFPADPSRLGWEQVLALADQCLYQAKLGGRNRWVGLLPVADPDLVPPTDAPVVDAPLLVERGWVVRRHGPEPTPPAG